MPHLADYVNAIHGLAGKLAICSKESRRESWQDQGYVVSREEHCYRFEDGALIKQEIETDDFPAEAVCAECWISYTVLTQPAQSSIHPPAIHFSNACREGYWRRYFSQ